MPYTFGDDYDDGVRYPNASSNYVYNFYQPSVYYSDEEYDDDIPYLQTDESEDYRNLPSDELYWDGEQWILNPFVPYNHREF